MTVRYMFRRDRKDRFLCKSIDFIELCGFMADTDLKFLYISAREGIRQVTAVILGQQC
ncbi:hypothetical protein NIT7645_02793 [Phaeobacter italicus]|nr:hypothetical protein NIT7645_02793 [Phaeobacter italicus]SFG68121.1 hypothetical protein SAMN04488019_10357 [Phaeobacter italicus]